MVKPIYTFIIVLFLSCGAQVSPDFKIEETVTSLNNNSSLDKICLDDLHPDFKTGADQMSRVTELLLGKKVGLVGNMSSLVNGVHLVDTLLGSGIALQRIFCPEHGFRGDEAAGAIIDNSIDPSTGLSIISLHGKHKKPKLEDIEDLEVLVFDIQDVGARFYTYISTLHYVMESAAEANISVLVLDRPNPNGHYIDGPILEAEFESFIGMHPVPIVHGMTVGEYAQMINGEGWLKNGVKCKLEVIACLNYSHNSKYTLPIKPSPNLPNQNSVYLYPSLCLFEGTAVSVGRGTDTPFQMYGHPLLKFHSFSFTPLPRKEAPDPKLNGKKCLGLFFSDEMVKMANDGMLYNPMEAPCNTQILLKPLLDCFEQINSQESFFSRPDFFDLLAGNNKLRLQILAGKSEAEIRNSWKEGLSLYKKMRSRYTIYP